MQINELFSINKVISKLKNCHKNIIENYDITSTTITEAFNYWQDYVIKNKSYDEKDIEIFSKAALTSPDDSFINMDEKTLMDYKDIICSEIISLSDTVVKYMDI